MCHGVCVWSHLLTCFETTKTSLVHWYVLQASQPLGFGDPYVCLPSHQRCIIMLAFCGFWGLKLRFSLTLAWQILYPQALPSSGRKTLWESIKIVSTCLVCCYMPIIPARGVARVETLQVRGSWEGGRGRQGWTSQLGLLTSFSWGSYDFCKQLLFVLSIAPHAVVFLVIFTQLNLKAYNHSLPHIWNSPESQVR